MHPKKSCLNCYYSKLTSYIYVLFAIHIMIKIIEQLVNFEGLSDFTANNLTFERQLIDAFVIDLELFKSSVFQEPDEAQFLEFRKAYHSIYPSLKMLRINQLIEAVETFKTAYSTQQESVSILAERIHQLIDIVGLEADQWRKS